MTIKLLPWGKILLFLGLSLVTLQGIWRDPLIRQEFGASEDPSVSELKAAGDSYEKIQSRMQIFRDLLKDLTQLQSPVSDPAPPQPRKLWGMAFPFSELGMRFFPNLSFALELRLARRELVNLERKMERLDLLLASIERQVTTGSKVNNPKPSPPQPQFETSLRRVETLRRHLLLNRADLNELSETLSLLKNK